MTDQYPDPFRHGPEDEVRRVGPWTGTPPWYVGVIGGMVFVVLIITVVLLARGDDQNIQTATPTTPSAAPTLPSTTSATSTTVPSSAASTTTTTTAASTTALPSTTPTSTTTTGSTTTTTTTATTATTTASSTTTTTAPTTTTVDPAHYASAVWPMFETSTRYQDPVSAARGFAEDLVGFDAPIIGEFQQGDSRSGEIEVRPAAGGPVTVVFVRQLGQDNSWWALGSASENITIQSPSAVDEINSPLTVSGDALAFEGVVSVALRADGNTNPLVEGSVVAGGTERKPFERQFTWTEQADGHGTLILFVESMNDGAVWEASVVRVAFTPT